MKSNFFIIGLAVLMVGLSSGCSKQGKAEKHLKAGDKYLASYQFEEARVVYLKVLQLQPSNSLAYVRLGNVLREDGNYLRAYQFLKRAQELAPADPAAALEMGELQFSVGDRDSARTNALNLLKKNQLPDRAARLLALTSMTSPQLEEARNLIEPLLKANPVSRTLNEAWAHWLLRHGQDDEAVKTFKKVIGLDPKSEDAYLAIASIYQSQNELEEARKTLEEAIRQVPPASRAGLMLVNLRLKSGSTEEGKKLLKQIVDKRSGFVSAWIIQAELNLAEKNYAEAAKRVKNILSLDPSNYSAQLIQGQVALAEGRWPDAVEQFQQLAKIYPKAGEPRYQLALAQLLKGETAMALQNLDASLQLDTNNFAASLLRAQLHLRTGAAPRAIQAMTAQLAKNPTNYQAFQILAQAYMATNEWTRALDTYKKASDIFPKNPEPIFLSGLIHLQQQRTNEAIQHFEKALQISTNYAAPMVQLVNIDALKKDFPAAIQRIRNYPPGRTNAELLILLARLEHLNGNPQEAEAVLHRAVEVEDEKRLATQELVKLYLSQTNQAAALQAVEKGLAEQPDHLALLARAALIYDNTKRFQEASQHYERILKKATNSTLALNNLAWLYSEELNQPEKAFDLGKKARQVNPNDPYTADTFGWILYRRGEYTWALSLLQESVQKLAEVPDVHAHLGLTYYMLGDEAQSQSALERALALPGDFREKTNALNALAILKLNPRQPDPESLKILNQRLTEKPNDPIALTKLGQSQEAKNDFESARKTYQRLLQAFPTSAPALLSLARLELYQFKDKAKALENLQKISADQMQNPVIGTVAGRLLLDAGETKRAYDILSVAARDASASPDTILAAALAALRTGRLVDAESGFKRLSVAKESNPGRTAAVYLGLLQSYNSRKKVKIDENTVVQILRQDPANEFARILQALALEQVGKWQESRDIYQDVLKTNPYSALAAKHLAALESSFSKNDDSSLALATKARETMQNDSELLTLLAQLNYRKTNYSRVITLASESLRAEPNQPEALYYLGLAQIQSGDKRTGTNTLTRALALAPQNPLAPQARQLLTK